MEVERILNIYRVEHEGCDARIAMGDDDEIQDVINDGAWVKIIGKVTSTFADDLTPMQRTDLMRFMAGLDTESFSIKSNT